MPALRAKTLACPSKVHKLRCHRDRNSLTSGGATIGRVDLFPIHFECPAAGDIDVCGLLNVHNVGGPGPREAEEVAEVPTVKSCLKHRREMGLSTNTTPWSTCPNTFFSQTAASFMVHQTRVSEIDKNSLPGSTTTRYPSLLKSSGQDSLQDTRKHGRVQSGATHLCHHPPETVRGSPPVPSPPPLR